MRIKLKVHLSGTRDGVEWPANGEEIDLPADEARDMILADMAEPVATHRDAETAVPAAAETRKALVPKRTLKGRAR